MSFTYLLSDNQYALKAGSLDVGSVSTSSITLPNDTEGEINFNGSIYTISQTTSQKVLQRTGVGLRYKVINNLMYIRLNSSTGTWTLVDNPDSGGWSTFYYGLWNDGDPIPFNIPYLINSGDYIMDSIVVSTYQNKNDLMVLTIDSQLGTSNGSWLFTFKTVSPSSGVYNGGQPFSINNFSITLPVSKI